MDDKIIILKTKLKQVRKKVSAISRDVNNLGNQLDVTMNFEDVSKLLTENRRGVLRAKQYAAEITQLINSEDSVSANYSDMKTNLMYKGELVEVSPANIITKNTVIDKVTAKFRNVGISHKWKTGTTVTLECEDHKNLNKTFVYNGADINYMEDLTAVFEYSSGIDLSGIEKIALIFKISENNIIIGTYNYIIEIREG